MTDTTQARPGAGGRIIIAADIEVLSGIHVGAWRDRGDTLAMEGAVVRDPVTQQPYLPGSTIRGRLRSLLETHLGLEPSRQPGGVWRHETADGTNAVSRLFGGRGQGLDKGGRSGRLLLRDAPLTAASVERLVEVDTEFYLTEVKAEASLDRMTAAAIPRLIERIPAGARLRFEAVYEAPRGAAEEVDEDLGALLTAMTLLGDASVGAHGSRGYGRVAVRRLRLTARRPAWYAAASEEERAAAEKSAEGEDPLGTRGVVVDLVGFLEGA